ncbi:MAG: endonuclease III [Candidatus Brocadiia bacterium]
MDSLEDRKRRVRTLIDRLESAYPDARCLLDFSTPLDLLVATILAAQCTDERVNKTTPEVFKRFQSPEDYANAHLNTLYSLFRPCGTYRQKARSVKKACQAIAEQHGGEVPRDIEQLSALPGVGRKTANVVLGNAFGVPSIIVDTHVLRLAGRLGLASPHNVKQKYADKIEQELLPIVPERQRTRFSHLLTFHGRFCCTARKPRCPECPIEDLCPYDQKTTEEQLKKGKRK